MFRLLAESREGRDLWLEAITRAGSRYSRQLEQGDNSCTEGWLQEEEEEEEEEKSEGEKEKEEKEQNEKKEEKEQNEKKEEKEEKEKKEESPTLSNHQTSCAPALSWESAKAPGEDVRGLRGLRSLMSSSPVLQ